MLLNNKEKIKRQKVKINKTALWFPLVKEYCHKHSQLNFPVRNEKGCYLATMAVSIIE